MMARSMSSSVRPDAAPHPGLDHDVLQLGVGLDGVHRHVLAHAGLLEAAVRHLRHERAVVVHPHRAEAQRVGHAQRPADVARPHRRRQPVVDAVGPRHRLGLVGEPLHGDDRTEDLALDDLAVLRGTGDRPWARSRSPCGRRPAPPVTAGAPAATARSTKPATRVALVGRHDRPELGGVVGWVADDQRARPRRPGRPRSRRGCPARPAPAWRRCSPARRCSSRRRARRRWRPRGRRRRTPRPAPCRPARGGRASACRRRPA